MPTDTLDPLQAFDAQWNSYASQFDAAEEAAKPELEAFDSQWNAYAEAHDQRQERVDHWIMTNPARALGGVIPADPSEISPESEELAPGSKNPIADLAITTKDFFKNPQRKVSFKGPTYKLTPEERAVAATEYRRQQTESGAAADPVREIIDRAPFAHDVFGIMDYKAADAAGKRIQAGTATDADYLQYSRVMEQMMKEGAEKRKADEAGFFSSDNAKHIAHMASYLPTFAAEMATTWGTYSTVSSVAEQGAIRTLKAGLKRQAIKGLSGNVAGRLALKSTIKGTGLLAGGAAQTAVNPASYLAHQAKRMLDVTTVERANDGTLRFVDQKNGEAFLPALGHGFLDSYVEVATEHTGQVVPWAGRALKGMLPRGVQLALNKVAVSELVAAYAKRKGIAVPQAIAELSKRASFNGLAGELFEEHPTGDVARRAAGLSEDLGTTGDLLAGATGDQKRLWRGVKEVLNEGAAFAPMMAAGPAYQSVGLLAPEVVQELEKASRELGRNPSRKAWLAQGLDPRATAADRSQYAASLAAMVDPPPAAPQQAPTTQTTTQTTSQPETAPEAITEEEQRRVDEMLAQAAAQAPVATDAAEWGSAVGQPGQTEADERVMPDPSRPVLQTGGMTSTQLDDLAQSRGITPWNKMWSPRRKAAVLEGREKAPGTPVEAPQPQTAPQSPRRLAPPQPPAEKRSEPITTFTTAKGSTYTWDGTSTQRTKAKHEFHDRGDVGLKEKSERTVFISPEHAQEVGMWQSLQAPSKVLLFDEATGDILLTSVQQGRRGVDGRLNVASTKPEVGLSPLELDTPSKSVPKGWRGTHPGSAITQIGEAGLPGMEDIDRAKGSAQEYAGTQPWEATPEELRESIDAVKAMDRDLEESLFGPDGAKRYRSAQATANSAYKSHAETDAAQKVIDEMEASLTEQHRRQLFGMDTPTFDVDELKDYRSALAKLDGGSAEDLGRSLAYAISTLGGIKGELDPQSLSHKQRLAYAQLLHGKRIAEKEGFDLDAVGRAAVVAAAARFKDPADAEFVLARWFTSPKKQPTIQQPESEVPDVFPPGVYGSFILPPLKIDTSRAQSARPDLSQIATSPGARAVVSAADTLRNAAGQPQTRADTETKAEAEAILADPARRTNLLAAVKRGGQINDAETLAAKAIISSEGAAAFQSNDPQAIANAVALIDAYRRTGVEAARAMRQRFDPIEGPEGRLRAFVEDALTPPDATQKKVDAAVSNGNQAEADRLREQWGKDFLKLKKRLKAYGVDLDNLNEWGYDPIKLSVAQREVSIAKATWSGMFREFFRGATLSPLTTAAANAMGNTAHSVYKFGVIEPLATLVPKSLDPQRPERGDVKQAFAEMLPAAVDSAKMAMITWRTESPQFEKWHGLPATLKADQTGAQIPGWFGRWVRSGFTGVTGQLGLLVGDDFAKGITARASVMLHANQLARDMKIPAAEKAAFVREQAQNIKSPSWQRAIQDAYELAFQQKGSPLAQGIKRGLLGARKLPYGAGEVAYYIAPYVSFAVNMGEKALRYSPAGSLKIAHDIVANVRAGRPALYGLSRQVAEQFVIAAVFFAILGTNDPDDPWLTGAKDELTEERRSLYQRGAIAPPQSVKFAKKWYSYARIEPLATVLAPLVDFTGALRKGRPVQAAHDTFSSIAGGMKNKTFLRGIGDLMTLFEKAAKGEGEEGLLDWSTSFGASWVPGIVKSAARAPEDEVAERRIWGHGSERVGLAAKRLAQKAELPAQLGLVEEQPKIDIWGRQMPKANSPIGSGPGTDIPWRILVPIEARDERQPFIGDQVLVNYAIENPGERYEDDPSDPKDPRNTWKDSSGKTHQMNDAQRAEFRTLGGRIAARLVELEPLNAEKPTADDVNTVKSLLGDGRSKAKELLAAKWQGKPHATEDFEALAKDIYEQHIVKRLKELSTERPGRTGKLDKDRAKLAEWEAKRTEAAAWLKAADVDLPTAQRIYYERHAKTIKTPSLRNASIRRMSAGLQGTSQ